MNPFRQSPAKATSAWRVVLLLLLVAGACEKYPDDIPEWLQDKIRYCAKEKNQCTGLSIEEYTYGEQKFYGFSYYNAMGYEELYNSAGEQLCDGYLIGLGYANDSCGWVPKNQLERVRHIWNEY